MIIHFVSKAAVPRLLRMIRKMERAGINTDIQRARDYLEYQVYF